jgi:hypothetical protein
LKARKITPKSTTGFIQIPTTLKREYFSCHWLPIAFKLLIIEMGSSAEKLHYRHKDICTSLKYTFQHWEDQFPHPLLQYGDRFRSISICFKCATFGMPGNKIFVRHNPD